MIGDCINYNKNSAFCEYIGHNVHCEYKGESSKCILQNNYNIHNSNNSSILPGTAKLKTKLYLRFMFTPNILNDGAAVWVTVLKAINNLGFAFNPDTFNVIYVKDDLDPNVVQCSGIIDKYFISIIKDESEVKQAMSNLVIYLTETLNVEILEMNCVTI